MQATINKLNNIVALYPGKDTMSSQFCVKTSNSPFCTKNNLINDYFSQRITNVEKCKNNHLSTDIKIDEWTILDLIESCSCEKTKEKLANLYANHIQKSVAINEAMKMYLGLSANEATVLGVIYIPTAKSGRGYLSNKMIMDSTGLSRSTIKRALRKFEAKGLIKTEYERDEINKMKVIRNYTFTRSFYGSAKITGCYTIQTPVQEDLGEIHEMSTKPIITQGSNWTIKNNIYTSILKSNYSQNKLLLSNSLQVKVNTGVSTNQEKEPSRSNPSINKHKKNLDSYDQIIEKFVHTNYKESHETLIDGLHSMLKVWYGSYKNKKTKLKLTNFELKSKLYKLQELSKGNSTLAVSIIGQSVRHYYSEFYMPSMKTAIALKDKVANKIVKLCQETINKIDPERDARTTQIFEEAYCLMDRAISSVSKWGQLQQQRLNELHNPLIGKEQIDKQGIPGTIERESFPNRLTNGEKSIDDKLVKANMQCCAFSLDEFEEDTDNPQQSVGTKTDMYEYLDESFDINNYLVINKDSINEQGKINTPTPNSAAPLPREGTGMTSVHIDSTKTSGLEPTIDPDRLLFDELLEKPSFDSYLLRLKDDIEMLRSIYRDVDLQKIEYEISKANILKYGGCEEQALETLFEAKKSINSLKKECKTKRKEEVKRLTTPKYKDERVIEFARKYASLASRIARMKMFGDRTDKLEEELEAKKKILDLDDEKLILKSLENSSLKDPIAIEAKNNRFEGCLDIDGGNSLDNKNFTEGLKSTQNDDEWTRRKKAKIESMRRHLTQDKKPPNDKKMDDTEWIKKMTEIIEPKTKPSPPTEDEIRSDKEWEEKMRKLIKKQLDLAKKNLNIKEYESVPDT